jgi:hypothetical protein
LEISQQNGIEIDTAIGDAVYSGRDNPKLVSKPNIKIVARMTPSISQGSRKDKNLFNYNKDAGMFVCPAGYLAIRKAKQGEKDNGQNQQRPITSTWKNARSAC